MLKEKQPLVFQQLLNSFQTNRLSHSYLFEGAKGTGKKEMATWFSQLVFCEDSSQGSCGQCLNCQRIATGNHPDVLTIIPDGQTIKVDQIREIKGNFVKSGMESQRKVMIIQEADKMTVSAANSLLKFIEEPEGEMTIIFLTESKAKILPTIQSRCQILHFSPLPQSALIADLMASGIEKQQAEFISQLTNSHEKAVEFSNDEWFNETTAVARKWCGLLLSDNPYAMVFVQQELVQQCKEKEQQILLIDMLLILVRQQLANKVTGSQQMTVQSKWSQKKLINGLETILKARQMFSANVSFQNVCEYLSLKLISG
ncbi:DNA polymerase III subunit delta' [Vagococcus coleopterorum]|uniref:DNA polymerase III subunit delta n=1 Tax=Vagococcus coleopterorum TaxID=2714946 RepID=A0A6G8AMX8_9ENTE|nr:DNA polymerase III subunit delta' [Vagococcus coleopterorum]QIL46357.1 DNA polymerase III subunit delta' [Vagococcus coleopterorum]